MQFRKIGIIYEVVTKNIKHSIFNQIMLILLIPDVYFFLPNRNILLKFKFGNIKLSINLKAKNINTKKIQLKTALNNGKKNKI